MAGFDSDALELIFGIALAAAVFASMAMLLAWHVWRFFRRGRLLGGLIYRTRLPWTLWVSTALALPIVASSIMAWRIFFLLRHMMGEFTGNVAAWLWIGPVGATAFSVGFLVLLAIILATRLEIRRWGLAAYGTWDVTWDRINRVVFLPERPRVWIEHDRGVSSSACPKSERSKVAEALREAGVEVVDDPDYRCSGNTVFWTFFRARALWTALAVGLAVFLAVVGGFYVSLGPEYAAAASLKETGANVDGVFFHFRSVIFEDGTEPTEAQLRLLHEFPELDWLDLSNTRLDDSITGPLAGLTRPVNLDLSGTQIGDKTVARLSGMQSLQRLNLSGTRVTGEGLSSIEGLRGLESLNLERTPMTPAGTESIGHLSNLHTLVLSETPVEDAWLAPLASLSRLKNLRLDKTAVADAGVKMLAQSESLRGLNGLSLSGTQITDAAAEALAQFNRLSWLELNETRITDVTVAALARHNALFDLSLADTQITDRAVTALAGAGRLIELNLAGTHITDASTDMLKEMTHLTELDLRDTGLSPEKAAEVAQALFDARVVWGEREEPEP